MRSTATTARSTAAAVASAMEALLPTSVAPTEPAALKLFSTSDVATSEAFAAVAAVSIKSTPAVVAASAVVAAIAIVPVEPGTSANEYAALKVIRSVVSVRGTCIWSVIVISVWARRRRSYVFGSAVIRCDADPYSPANLSVCTPREHHEQPDQKHIF